MPIILLIMSIVSVVISLIMVFAFIATKNAVIDIVMSFETQNSNSYEIRLKVFNRAIAFLSNLESKTIDETTKKKELGQIFDNLLMVSTTTKTLSTFEAVVKTYFEDSFLDEKAFIKFKACVRKEFGAKKYNTKVIYNYAEPSGVISFGMFEDKDPQPKTTTTTEGMPLGAKVNTPAKTNIPAGAPQVGATFVTAKTQETTVPPVTPVTPGINPVKPVNPFTPNTANAPVTPNPMNTTPVNPNPINPNQPRPIVPPVNPGAPKIQPNPNPTMNPGIRPVPPQPGTINPAIRPGTPNPVRPMPDNIIAAKPTENKNNNDKE